MIEVLDSVPVMSRTIEVVAGLHGGLPIEFFAGKTILDLGCGGSELGDDLAWQGIQAKVIGIDMNRDALRTHIGNKTDPRIQASLCKLPIRDQSVDLAIATYSLPYWAASSAAIKDFYAEAHRVVKVDGHLAVVPVDVTRVERREDLSQRQLTAQGQYEAFLHLHGWVMTSMDYNHLLARRIS